MKNGGIIGPKNNTSETTASGVWSLGEQYSAIRNSRWPRYYFGPEYGGWNGQSINFSTTSDLSGTTSFLGLDGALDSSTQRLYDGYAGNGTQGYYTGGYFGWATKTTLPNIASTDGRSATIGYHSGTAYLYMGNVDATIDIYLLSDLSYVATWTVSGFTSQVSGLAYDGRGGILAIGLHARTTLFRLDTVEPITQTVVPSTLLTNLPANTEFGLLFNGENFLYRNRVSGDGKVYECKISDGSVVKTFSPTSLTAYGISIDYGNKKLYTGGLSDTTMLRFSGT
jgi:hypothetical protein